MANQYCKAKHYGQVLLYGQVLCGLKLLYGQELLDGLELMYEQAFFYGRMAKNCTAYRCTAKRIQV